MELVDMRDLGDVTTVKVLGGQAMENSKKTKRLPNSFFQKNPLQHLSAAMIAHYTITERLNEKFDSLVYNLTEEGIDDVRKAKIQQERQRIEETNDPAALVEFMRKGHDVFNQNLLCKKILQNQEETMSLLLKRYRTCALDQFIDAATAVFATGEQKYAHQLRDIYADIRNPFAQACACLVFGMQEMDEEIPFLLHEYERFQREYPNETYHQHPLLSLYLLHGKY